MTGVRPGGFIPEKDRIAVFDNDGTLCTEMPVLMQFAFTMSRVQAMASGHPEWRDLSPFREILDGDMHGALSGGTGVISRVLAATYAGMTTDEFSQEVTRWIHTARHPSSGRLYPEMVYQPMLELLAYLRENLFKIYIVSASGIDFMRPWTHQVYGILPENVIGSSIRLKYEDHAAGPVLVRIPELELFDEGHEKPVAIHHFIGTRPILAFGDSDGDLEMLKWVSSSTGPRFAGLIHHTDNEREYEYDDEEYGGALASGRNHRVMAEAQSQGWTIVDMKTDWKRIYPFR